MRKKLKLKDMGDNRYYMGCPITRDRKTRELKLDLRFYVKSMEEKFGVGKASRIPASSGVPAPLKVDQPQTLEEKEDILKFPHREAVGAFM